MHSDPYLRSKRAQDDRAPELIIGSRYSITRTLGRGGMATVFEAVDLGTGKPCALKRLDPQADPKRARRAAELFEREYHQLAELAHPRVVSVYSYGLHDDAPYYTMELLTGGDLAGLAPLDWRRACAIARDVCSALSLLHSRQLVHRDISPRNVRCTTDGSAKLIDFGALAPFGPVTLVVGTPACCAPEVVAARSLDARTDLYSLGATLYFLLAGRHAYQARHFAQLADCWRERLIRPSQWDPSVPEALEALILELLRLEPDARPTSAAEVMLRLSAIDGVPPDEGLLVKRAYLSTPVLVGRARPLARARAELKRAKRERAAVLTIEGASGIGRSRFLEAVLLKAALLDMRVVRIDADHARAGDWGLVQSLAAELQDMLPDATLQAARPWLDVLGHVLPELAQRAPEIALRQIEPGRLRPTIQHALRKWFFALLELQGDKPLLIAVDDLPRADEPSTSWLALLACEPPPRALALIATLENDASPHNAACTLLRSHSTPLSLRALEDKDAERLLRSLFGDIPNSAGWARRLWTLSEGNPKQFMRLAQHLVDQELVHYEAGAWVLPSAVGGAQLPLNASDAQRARAHALSLEARALAIALALCPDLDFSYAECALLCAANANAAVEELRRAEIARVVRERVTLGHPTWSAVLCAQLSAAERRRAHLALADALALRSDQPFRVGQHLLLAGEIDRGLERLVTHAAQSQEETSVSEAAFQSYVRSLPPDWLQVFRDAVALCKERGRPRSQRFALLSRLAGILAMRGVEEMELTTELMRELELDSGLSDWARLDAGLEPMQRLTLALQQTQARYDAAPPEQRNLDPLNAIKQLARGIAAVSAVAATGMDVRAVRALPSLTPLTPLSVALSLIQLLREGMIERYSGRYERAAACYQQIIDRMNQPDGGGLDPAHSGYVRRGVMNGLAMLEAGMAKDSCLSYADELDREPTHHVNALQLRMLYQLWQGDGIAAEQSKRSIDRVRLENDARHWFEVSHLLWEVVAHALCGALTPLQQVRQELAPLALRYATWRALDHYAAAHHRLGCGDLAAASAHIEQALTLSAAGEHPAWAQIAATDVRILLAHKRSREAARLGAEYLQQAELVQLDYQTEYLRLALALALASEGEHAAAVSCADRAIARFTSSGIGGLNLGYAYETRARVALRAGDRAACEHYGELTAQLYLAHRYPPLAARHDKLLRDADRRFRRESPLPAAAHRSSTLHAISSESRADSTLALLIEQSHANGGFLFRIANDKAHCIAHSGDSDPSPRLLRLIDAFLAREIANDTEMTRESGNDTELAASTWTEVDGRDYRPVVLGSYADGRHVVQGVAVLQLSEERPFVYPAALASELGSFNEIETTTTSAQV